MRAILSLAVLILLTVPAAAADAQGACNAAASSAAAIPDTPRLALALCAAVEGSLPAIAVISHKTAAIQFARYTTGPELAGLKPSDSCVLGPP